MTPEEERILVGKVERLNDAVAHLETAQAFRVTKLEAAVEALREQSNGIDLELQEMATSDDLQLTLDQYDYLKGQLENAYIALFFLGSLTLILLITVLST